jgi:hypothetical protein
MHCVSFVIVVAEQERFCELVSRADKVIVLRCCQRIGDSGGSCLGMFQNRLLARDNGRFDIDFGNRTAKNNVC